MTSDASRPTSATESFKHWTRRLLIAVAAMLAVWRIGWLGVTHLLKLRLQKQGSAQLGREVTMERVVFLPWSLELTVSGVRVAVASDSGTQFALDRLYLVGPDLFKPTRLIRR